MKFVVRVTDSAIIDQIEAASWYERQQERLWIEFSEKVRASLQELETEAMLHPVRFGDVRRAAVMRFTSYGVFYIVRDNHVTVFAVMHGARNPVWVRKRRGRFL